MKTIGHTGFTLITLLLCLPAMMYSQEGDKPSKNLRFFTEMAVEDANYEQNIQLNYTEDEIDFWNDQRNFERALKKQSYTNYKAYIATKSEVYSKHGNSHKIDCKHSDSYYLQAAFYAQTNPKDFMISTNSAPVNVTAQTGPSATKVDH